MGRKISDEVWFNNDPKENDLSQLKSLKDKNIKRYCVKTITSGDMRECEIYPIFKTNRGNQRAKKEKPSREAQAKLNEKNVRKKITRWMHANFVQGDIYGTVGYDKENLPKDEKEAQKNISKFFRNLRNYLKRNSSKYGNIELKYLYVTEYEDNAKKGKKRVHHHIVTNFPDRDAFEDIWKKGKRSQTRRLAPDDYGLEGLARYISKNPKGTKRFGKSKNLANPIITRAYTKITKRRAQILATHQNAAPIFFEKMNEGYLFKDMEVKFSDFVSGAYLYVRMKRLEPEVQKRRHKQNENRTNRR